MQLFVLVALVGRLEVVFRALELTQRKIWQSMGLGMGT